MISGTPLLLFIVIGLKASTGSDDLPLDHHKVVRRVERTKAGGSRAAGDGPVVDV